MDFEGWCHQNEGRYSESDRSKICDFDNGVVKDMGDGILVTSSEMDEHFRNKKFGPENVQPNPGEDLDDVLTVDNGEGEHLIEIRHQRIDHDGPY